MFLFPSTLLEVAIAFDRSKNLEPPGQHGDELKDGRAAWKSASDASLVS